MQRIKLPSPGVTVAFVALVVALSGTAIALPGTGRVDSGDIRNGAVKSADIGQSQVRSRDIRNSSVFTQDIRNETVRSRDIAANTVTGGDINESTLGAVPNAVNATNATNAANANAANTAATVNTLRTVPVTTVNEGSSTDLASYGPFTLAGRCAADGGDTDAEILLTTTEDNSAWAANDGSDGDFDAGESPVQLQEADDAAGGSPSTGLGYDDTFTAFAPSGRAITGVMSPWADASAGSSGVCKFHGSFTVNG